MTDRSAHKYIVHSMQGSNPNDGGCNGSVNGQMVFRNII